MPGEQSAKSKKRRRVRSKKKCANKAAYELKTSAEVSSKTSSSCLPGAGVSGNIQVVVTEEDAMGDIIDVEFENDSSKCEDGINKSVSIESNLTFSKNSTAVELKEPVYNVESPERTLKKPPKKKLLHVPKSKSLDNDEDSQLNIVEITEHFEGDSNDEKSEKTMPIESIAVISEAESDVEWEIADDIKDKANVDRSIVKGMLSIETISLDQAECEHIQSLSPEEELSLRQYLQSLHLATSSDVCPLENRAKESEADIYVNNTEKSSSKGKKKLIAEEIIRHAALKPRFLEVIDEEGSSESSLTTRRHSYLNESQNEFDDLEDDVFVDNKQIMKQHSDNFPKSFTNNRNKNDKSIIHQECLLLDTKFIEPVIKEGCGDWKLETLEKIDGAEVVYLDDSSSSTSDIYDIIEEGDEMQEFDEDVEIRTPIIEMEPTGAVKPNFCDMGRSLKTPPPSPQVNFDVDDSIELIEHQACQSEIETSLSDAQNVQSEFTVPTLGSECNKIIYHKIELCASENGDSDKILQNRSIDNNQNTSNPRIVVDVLPISNISSDDTNHISSDSLPIYIEEKSVSTSTDDQKSISDRTNEKIIPITLVDGNPIEEKTVPGTSIKHDYESVVTSTDKKSNTSKDIRSKFNTTALVDNKTNFISIPVQERSVSTLQTDNTSSQNEKSNSTTSISKQSNSTVFIHEHCNKTLQIDEKSKKTSTPVEEKIIPITLQSTNLQSINQQYISNIQEKDNSTVVIDEKYKAPSMPAEEKIVPITLVNQISYSNVEAHNVSTVGFDDKLEKSPILVQEKIIPITLDDQISPPNFKDKEKVTPRVNANKKLKSTSIPIKEKIIPITLDDKMSSSNVESEKIVQTVLFDKKNKTASQPGQEKIIPISVINQKYNSNLQLAEKIIPTTVVEEKSKMSVTPIVEKIIPITLVNQNVKSKEQVKEKIISTVLNDEDRQTNYKYIEDKTIPVTLNHKTDSSAQFVEKIIPITLVNEKFDSIPPVDKKTIPTVLVENKTDTKRIINEKSISTSASYTEKVANHQLVLNTSTDENKLPMGSDLLKSNKNILIDDESNRTSKVIQENLNAFKNTDSELNKLSDKVIDLANQNKSDLTELVDEKSNSILAAEPKINQISDINILKDELNAALINLMQQVTEDSNESKNISVDTAYSRQDSSSSIASSQSQSTARYNPNTSSLTDITNILQDDLSSNDVKMNVDGSKSHVKEVIECIADSTSNVIIPDPGLKQPLTLKEICVGKIAKLPYGKAILEELAILSESLKEVITVERDVHQDLNSYPKILDKMMLGTKQTSDYSLLSSKDYRPLNYAKIPPPPVAPRHSSLKITTEDVLKNRSNAVSSPFGLNTDKTSWLHESSEVNSKKTEHNSYLTETTYQESKKTDVKNSINTSTSPFKSQTGNRLLAIIQDPSINVNLTQFRTSSNQTQDYKPTSLNTPYFKSENIFNLNTNIIKKSIDNDIHTIQPEAPIPPPRTRKYKTTNYESDDSSEMTDNSHYSRSERKHFYSSLGNINEDFESSTSAYHLQYLYKKGSRAKDHIDLFSDSTYSDFESNIPKRRLSLPRDICDQQMEYVISKEKQIEDEFKRMETPQERFKGPRAPLLSEKEYREENTFDTKKFHISRRGDFAVFPESGPTLNERSRPAHLSSSQEELFREKMYTEYMNKFAERAERKQHKIIKITSAPLTADYRHNSQSLPVLNHNLNQEIKKTCNKIEEEFISKAKQRWDKIGFKDPETDDEREKTKSQNKPIVKEHTIKVIEEGKEKDMTRLPHHLREFVQFTAGDKDPATSSPETVMIAPTFKARATSPAIWSPGSGVRAASPPPGAPPAPPPPGESRDSLDRGEGCSPPSCCGLREVRGD